MTVKVTNMNTSWVKVFDIKCIVCQYVCWSIKKWEFVQYILHVVVQMNIILQVIRSVNHDFPNCLQKNSPSQGSPPFGGCHRVLVMPVGAAIGWWWAQLSIKYRGRHQHDKKHLKWQTMGRKKWGKTIEEYFMFPVRPKSYLKWRLFLYCNLPAECGSYALASHLLVFHHPLYIL